MWQQWFTEFADDKKVQILLLLLVADFFVGVAGAVKQGTFRLSYVADLLKRDALGKVVPYFGFYVLALVQGNEDLLIPGIDFGVIAGAAYALAVAAMIGSILNGLTPFGIKLPVTIAGDENPDTSGNVSAAQTPTPAGKPR